MPPDDPVITSLALLGDLGELLEAATVEDVLRGGELTPLADDSGRRYEDDRLQQIWELDGLPEDVRRGMIRFAEGWLGISEGGESAQMAG